jgi:exonuclease VII small subunit
MADKKINLSANLQKLSEIANWFDQQEEVDVEEGLQKVKDAAVLIKESRNRLKEIENEFQEIKKEIDQEDEDPEATGDDR